MRARRFVVLASLAALVVLSALPVATAPQAPRVAPGYAQFLSPASPLELVAAKKVDRVAWASFEEGKRNAYTAAAPAWVPVRLTSFLKDDGIDLSGVRISDDGSTVVFVRGTAPNRDGWVANASADPNGPERAVWGAKTAGGPAFRVVEGGAPELAPDGSSVLIVREGQIHRARVTPVRPATEMDRGEKPFIRGWGVQSSPKWSPDGRKIAFVTTRTDHSFIAVYDMATRTVSYMAPSVDFDSNPLWTNDGKQIVFVRRPGLPFGQQGQQGGGGIGVPNGPAFQANPAAGRGAGRGRAGGGGQGNAAAPGSQSAAPVAQIPGLSRATFKGGYTLGIWKADVATGEGHEVWHNQPNDPMFGNLVNLRLANDRVVFPLNIGGGGRGGRGRGAQT